MALLLAEAQKLSNNTLVAGVIEEIINKEDLFAILPFTQVNSKAYVYHRENTLATADFLDPNDAVNEGATSFTEVVATLKILAGDVDIDKFLQATMSDSNDQMAIQVAKKAKALAIAFKTALGAQTTAAKTFDGLKVLTTAGQTLNSVTANANGTALTFSALDALVDQVPNGPDVLIMHRNAIRAYRALLRAAGGNDGAIVQMDNFGRAMLTHNGIPIIANDYLSVAETEGSSTGICTSVYAARLNEVDGLHGLYGGDAAGIVVENVGTVQSKDATRIRLKWYCGTALKSTKSLARLRGVIV